jgi:hypothetical protein
MLLKAPVSMRKSFPGEATLAGAPAEAEALFKDEVIDAALLADAAFCPIPKQEKAATKAVIWT